MRRSLLLIVFIAILPALLFAATTGKIAGKVVDKETGEALPAVNVTIDGTSMGAATDINGEYFILNIPVGAYTVRAQMISYKAMVMKDVRVKVDLTTRINFSLEAAVLDGEEVTIVADRPIIQKDMTSSRTIQTGEDMIAAPLENIESAVALTAGVSDNNFRGGREGEAVFMLDGVALVDPMTGTYESDVPLMAVAEMSVETGGFSAEYGNIQSGLVNIVMREGGTNYSGALRYKTNDFGSESFNENFVSEFLTLADLKDNKMQIANLTHLENQKNLEFSFGGPEPITNYFWKSFPGEMNFFLSGELFDSREMLPGQSNKKGSINGKLTYKPNPNIKIILGGFYTWRDRTVYVHDWSHTTYESQIDSTNEKTLGWDLNGNDKIDGWVKGTDLDHDGDLNDAFSMLDNLPYYNYNTDNINLTWTHQVSSKTFYEVKLSRYFTKMHYNVDENINEDTDGDRHLDLFVNGVDLDGDADKRHEDLNGNLIWDWKESGGHTDLFADENDNGYIDASEWTTKDKWVPWVDLPFGRYRDTNNFYLYGFNENLSYYRLRWNNDEKDTYGIKVNVTSQLNPRHQLKGGMSFDYMQIMSHNVDLASGGNVYGENFTVFPRQGAFYLEDKMEYEGMILKVGLRYDFFDANFDNYPSDVENPVPDSVKSSGGIIQNPMSVPVKSNWSPRLGVSYPITTHDVLRFTYGKYFQQPQLRYAFSNLTFDLSGAFPLIGNANIDPERTTMYEIGWEHAFNDDFKLSTTGFYKDITGLVDTRQVYYTVANWYGLYVNGDYGNVRGFEMTFTKRRTPRGFFSGNINYTFSVAKGKSGSARQNYDYAWAGDVIPTTESYLDWDERHAIKANLDVRVPEDGTFLGTSALNGLGMNVIWSYGSGFPYSPPQRSKERLINTERFPYRMTTDLTFDKPFKLGRNMRATFFVWINNLFNRKNIDEYWIVGGDIENWYHTYKTIQDDYDAGKMTYDNYMKLMDQQDPNDINKDGITDNQPDGQVDTNKKYPEMGSTLDPRVYHALRSVLFGVSFDF